MADVVATAVVEEAVRSCFHAVGHYISYTRKYKRNIQSLKLELKRIDDSQVTMLAEVRTAENNAEDIRQDVLGWLQKCEELKRQANEFLENEMSFNVRCLCCSCPNLKSRYVASSEAVEIASLITGHLEKCKFDRVGQEPQLGMLPLLSPGEFHGFESRMVIMKEVMDDLQNDSISVIGLCGMGGIGKTTLVKRIAEEVKSEKLFDEVAFVVVPLSKRKSFLMGSSTGFHQNVRAIQDQLASRLGLKAIENEMDINGRAQLLYKRLMDEKKKILVILDDMWEELNLRSVGIPIHGDRNGFKIIVTTRFDSVCTDMKVQKILEVSILSNSEAWNLFDMTAEISDESISHTAKEVTQECAGLPLAIVTVAKSLRNKKEHAFRNVLRKLRDPVGSNTSRTHDVLYSCIKSSYDYLDSDDHRLLLLLCSIFPEDYDIPREDLVRYARGLFETFETMAEARDRVEDIVDELMNCYLLLQGELRKCVKLHDVVRDVCMSIASKSGDVHIMLKFDDLNNMLLGMKSQRLRLLRMVNEEYFWKSEFHSGSMRLEKTLNREMAFSEEMQELRVLEVNHITARVPSSLQFMVKLQTLTLDYCRLQGDFAAIGSLIMLRVLSFFHSIVEMFPMEIAKLTNLQCLDLRFKLVRPATLALGTLSNLKELEELYLGEIGSLDIQSLKEVRFFSKLHTIQFVVEDNKCFEVLLKNLNLSNLNKFHIARDLEDGGRIEYQIRENVLELHQKNVHIDLYLLKELMWRVEWFYLNGHGLTNVVDVLGKDNGFPNLKELKLHNCDMKYLLDATGKLAKGDLSKLETLRIHNAGKLEELIHGDNPVVTLSGPQEMRLGNLNVSGLFQSPLCNLRRLEVFQCGKLKTLFSKSMVSCLGRLEFIEIKFCPLFERIVRIQKDDKVDCSQVSEFPKLKQLILNELPEFGVVAGLNEVMLHKLEHLTIMLNDSIKERGGEVCFYLGSSLPKVCYLDIMKCNNLLTIAKSGLVHGFQDLQTLRVRDCSSVDVVFDFEEIMGHLSAETQETTVLARLEELDLSYLSSLEHICTMLPPKGTPVFSNLTKIQVKSGNNLIYLLTPSIVNMLVQLEEIKLHHNNLMETIIGSGEIDMPNGGEQILLERLVLPKLKSLMVKRLPSLKGFSPGINLELPSLTEFQIINSPVDILTRETHALQNLTTLRVENCDTFNYLFTSSAAQFLVHLQELVLHSNKSMEAIFEYEISKTVVLPKLRKLEISRLPNFKMLCCSLDLNVDLPSLTQLHIERCPEMRKLCAGQLSAPQLIKVNYGRWSEIEIGTFINSWLKDCESMIRCLDCASTSGYQTTCSHLLYPKGAMPNRLSFSSVQSNHEYLYTAPSSLGYNSSPQLYVNAITYNSSLYNSAATNLWFPMEKPTEVDESDED